VSALKLSGKTAEKNYAYRLFFKKWLDLEKRRGDEEGAEAVKQKAIEWTQKAVNS
jgi:hypothetical protein